ncbi:ABC transporter ATP-binding protein [Mycoplasma bovis]|uniref:Drug exporter-2 (DrugE2) ABC transporter family, permease/ATP-binding protein n=1 Tax=Mycoplasmopsis bovis (strain ATCC 25523 / DSM 22781 / NCTC 10131 / PG45) TaxID=289397 RepID=A0A454AP24_MYCBG|nr:ABC transporter ATP-binding protein [Mycoplasmopsis bovis]ADR24770.1 drug exporter-2 (DrugE2) ABC transporter family, permease/ATP-binding protein [Mycoplasmopsis bovis PG45]AXJ68873.1 ABC transporter ATP-binding protein [Mycoplasmopsis bovis]AXJ74548.1 ABC transporter ATP-binding protein [Mycoplasmopsis bovis]MBT1316402.1 ABC transporter ATP-binding protein [Mycoplasmopsis bovis]MBT1331426.1 ABC transporter ATP-binding protein [Mycoplasmopsis bovis]
MLKMVKILPSRIKWVFIIGSFLTLIYVLLNVMLPLLIKKYIDLILTEDRIAPYHMDFLNGRIDFGFITYNQAFKWLTIIVLLQTISTASLAFLSTLVIVLAAERSSYFYRNTLYKKIQSYSLKNIADLKAESIITRLSNDIAIFWEFLVNGTSVMIKGIFLIIGGLTVAALVDWQMSLSIIAIIPIVIVMGSIISVKTGPLLKKTQKAVDAVTKVVDENISGIRVIKTFNLETKRLNVLKEINNAWYDSQYKSTMIFSTAYPVFQMLLNWLMIGIYSVVGYYATISKINKDIITNINLFIDLLWQVAAGILLMLLFLSSLFRAKVAAARIIEAYDYETDNLYVSKGEIIDSYDIEIKNLSFKYYDASPNFAIANVDITLPYKKSLGIIGPMGSGKSTIVNLLVNNYKYNEGSIKIGNKEVSQVNSKNLHDTVGIVHQESLLYTGTIRSNMLWAKEDASDDEIMQALKDACADEFVSKFEDGLDHPVYQGGKNLSGGQKQRLSIARSLLRKPKILILDDSTSALDNITASKVIDNIKDKYECSTIIISQKISNIKNADEIIVMSTNGFIISRGTHNQLAQSCEFYKQIYETQLEQ